MYPRLRIDILWRDLAYAIGRCVWPAGEVPLGLRAQAASEALPTLSVRSAFDLLLAALDLPAGSEVLLSEVTVPHLPRIVREHRLVPVPVPVNARTLAVDVRDVRQRISSQTKVLVIAHLFGSRMPLEALGELCHEHDILLVEDCAQALTSGNIARDAAADVSLYSFGPIKTATAMGGGIALVRDGLLRNRMTHTARTWPTQSTGGYALRIAKAAVLKLLSPRWVFTPLVGLIAAAGGDADRFVGHSARGFPDHRLFDCLRQQPCTALQCLMARRLSQFDKQSIRQRIARGRQLAAAIEPTGSAAGCDNSRHTYWVFPVVCDQPANVVRALRRAGFDASQISGLTVVREAVAGEAIGDAAVGGDHRSGHWLARVVFLPHGPQVPEAELLRAARLVSQSLPASPVRGGNIEVATQKA